MSLILELNAHPQKVPSEPCRELSCHLVSSMSMTQWYQ